MPQIQFTNTACVSNDRAFTQRRKYKLNRHRKPSVITIPENVTNAKMCDISILFSSKYFYREKKHI